MERRCEMCRQWEGHAYCKARKRFWFPMQDNFTEDSHIPEDFIKNLKEKLGTVVYLKGPSGKTWDVTLKNTCGTMVFSDGWKDFIEENLVENNDLLFFTYKGDSHFKVSIFNTHGCEKTSPYLIKECNHQSVSEGNAKDAEDSIVFLPTHRPICPVIELTEDDQLMEPGGSSSGGQQKKKKKKKLKKTASLKEHQDDQQCHKKAKVEADSSSIQPDDTKWSPSGSDGSHEGNTSSRRSAFAKSYQSYLLSTRRKVTPEEIEKASKRAREFKSNNPFFWKSMTATHVYRGFFMAVPKKFAADYFPSQLAKVTLRTPHGKETWVVSFRKEICSYGFGGDWRKFVQDNDLEKGDACVFELQESKKGMIMMHVHIFRVVELESSEPPQPRPFRR